MARGLRRRSRAASGSDDHDEVALSGWLFADLILGLFIVFLGAVTIRYIAPPEPEPEIEDESAGEGLGEELTCVTAMSSEVVEIEVPRGVGPVEMVRITEERIAAELAKRDDVEADAIFPFAMFFGRPDPGTAANDRASIGTTRAAQVRSVVLDGLPDRFVNTAYRDFFTSAGDTAANVRLDLFPQVTVCS